MAAHGTIDHYKVIRAQYNATCDKSICIGELLSSTCQSALGAFLVMVAVQLCTAITDISLWSARVALKNLKYEQSGRAHIRLSCHGMQSRRLCGTGVDHRSITTDCANVTSRYSVSACSHCLTAPANVIL